MNPVDFIKFSEALDRACMDIGKDSMSVERRQSLFNRYSGYELSALTNAIYVASGDPQSGFNGITPAILDKHLGVKSLADLDWQDVLALARLKNCPLGIVASLHIGAYNLKEKSDLDNMVAAKSFIIELPKIADRMNRGELDDHEITIMHKNGIQPHLVPIMPGLSLPYGAALIAQKTEHAKRLISYSEHNDKPEVLALESSSEGKLKVAKEIAKIGSDIDVPVQSQAAIDSDDKVFNEMMGKV